MIGNRGDKVASMAVGQRGSATEGAAAHGISCTVESELRLARLANRDEFQT